jgi:hypothetical protein
MIYENSEQQSVKVENTQKMAHRLPSTFKPKRGSLTKQQVLIAVNPHMPRRNPLCAKGMIYTGEPNKAILCNETSQLAKLPAEVLILILRDVPIDSYLDIVQTSKHLRQFVRQHAARLCNAAILERVPLEAARIPSVKVNGWLVPTHADLLVLERYLVDKKQYTDRAKGIIPDHPNQTRDLQIKLSRPGPQYLMWLLSGKVIPPNTPMDEKGKVKAINVLHVVKFLKPLNAELMIVGQDEGKVPRGLTRREFIWYLGVPEED